MLFCPIPYIGIGKQNNRVGQLSSCASRTLGQEKTTPFAWYTLMLIYGLWDVASLVL